MSGDATTPPITPCPLCRSHRVHHLPETSAHALVNYFRCETCGHVWTVHKETGTVRRVTWARDDK